MFALALVATANLEGPTARSCSEAGGAVEACAVTVNSVQMGDQRIVPGDGTQFVRLMTVWPEEIVDLVLVCVDPATEELGCPSTLRTSTRAVDDSGTSIGDLIPAPLS